jgi:hypothetical protein
MKHSLTVNKGLLCLLLALAVTGAAGFSFLPAGATERFPATSERCPKADDLIKPDDKAGRGIRDALPQLIREAYGEDSRYQNYEVKRIIPLADPEASPYSEIAEQQCGQAVAGKSLLVELFFPEFLPSASLSQGQIFVAKTDEGWKVWRRHR